MEWIQIFLRIVRVQSCVLEQKFKSDERMGVDFAKRMVIDYRLNL